MDRWQEMEQQHNRTEVDGRTCDYCGATDIDSIFLHRHVCPDDPQHRENYDTDYLERQLLGELRTCGTCKHHDRAAMRCKVDENPTPDQPAYPSDSCHFWEYKKGPG